MNSRLIVGIVLSVVLHVGLLGVNAFQMAPAEMELDSGTIAVELKLMPSVASAPAVVEPEPVVEQPEPVEEPIVEPIPEPEPDIVIPVPIVEEPLEIIEPVEQTEPEPELQEMVQEAPEPSVASIEQDGSLEEDKGAFTEAAAESHCSASYPPLSRRRGEEGVVILSFDVSAAGKVSNIRVDQSSGFKRLDKAAIKAVRYARFKPAERFGKSVTSTLIQTFNFRLTDD